MLFWSGEVEGNWTLRASVVVFCYSPAREDDCGKTCADRLVLTWGRRGSLHNQYADRYSSLLPWHFKEQIVIHYVTSHPLFDFIVSVTVLSKTTWHAEISQHLLQISNAVDCEHARYDFHAISGDPRLSCPFLMVCCMLFFDDGRSGSGFFPFHTPTPIRHPL